MELIMKFNIHLTLILTICAASSMLGMNETTKNRLDLLQKQIFSTGQTHIEENTTSENEFSKELQEQLQILKDKIGKDKGFSYTKEIYDLLVGTFDRCNKTLELFEKALASVINQENFNDFFDFLYANSHWHHTIDAVIKPVITKNTFAKTEPDIVEFFLENKNQSNEDRAKVYREFLSYITDDNFKDIHHKTIEHLLLKDESSEQTTLKTFCSYVTKETIATISPYIIEILISYDNSPEQNTLISLTSLTQEVIASLRNAIKMEGHHIQASALKHIYKLSKNTEAFAENIRPLLHDILFEKKSYNRTYLRDIIRQDPLSDKIIIATAFALLAPENFTQACPINLVTLLDNDEGYTELKIASTIMSWINQTNFASVDAQIIDTLIAPNALTKQNVLETFLGYITLDTFTTVSSRTVDTLIYRDRSSEKKVVHTLSSYVTKDNFHSVDMRIIEDLIQNYPSSSLKENKLFKNFLSYLTNNDLPQLVSTLEKNLTTNARAYTHFVFELCNSSKDFEKQIKSILSNVTITTVAISTLQTMIEVCPHLALFCAEKITSQDLVDNRPVSFCEYVVPVLLKADESCVPVIAKLIEQEMLKEECITSVARAIVQQDASYATKISSLLTKKNISKYYIARDLAPALIQADASCASTIVNLIDQRSITDEKICTHVIPELLKVDSTFAVTLAKSINKDNITSGYVASYAVSEILKANPACAKSIQPLITSKDILDNANIARWTVPALLQADATYGATIVQMIDESNITTETMRESILPALLKTDISHSKTINTYITKDTIYKIPINLLKLLIKQDANDSIGTIIQYLYSQKTKLDNDAVEIYLIDNKKGSNYLQNNQLPELLKIKNNTLTKKQNYQHFASTYTGIIERFDKYFQNAPDKRMSILKILKQEKIEHNDHNRLYQMYHGRAGSQFVTDHVFQYLQEILFGKVIDKTSHYAQHYGFPGEIWDRTITSRDKVYDFRGSPINLLENKVEDLLKQGITCYEEYSYERSCLQFASDLFGIKHGSSALSYTLRNSNVDKSRGDSAIADLFKRLGKALSKDVSSYYKKYEKQFEQLVELGKQFKHGTMLMYSFSKDMFQKYVYATHDSGGHKSDPIKINGKETFDPVLVQDTLRNNPELFDDQNKEWEYCMILTDEGIANPFHEDIRTYHFNIGKHDEQLAREIKHKLAYLFELIKIDMAQDGIIEYAVKTSKL